MPLSRTYDFFLPLRSPTESAPQLGPPCKRIPGTNAGTAFPGD